MKGCKGKKVYRARKDVYVKITFISVNSKPNKRVPPCVPAGVPSVPAALTRASKCVLLSVVRRVDVRRPAL